MADKVDELRSLLLRHDPFEEMASAPPTAEESTGRRIVRATLKGATLGMGQRGFESEGIIENLAELGGSVPSVVGLSALATPAVGLGARAVGLGSKFVKLAPLAQRTIASGAAGSTLGTGKALTSGDVSQIPKEAAWWTGTELGVGAIAKGYRKLRPLAAKKETTKVDQNITASGVPIMPPGGSPWRTVTFPEGEDVGGILYTWRYLWS